VVAGVAAAALAIPAAAGAHPAYVDQDTTEPEDPQCALPANPCDTIAEGIVQAEPGLPVIVDDSPAPYEENVTIGSGRTLVAVDFDNFSEGPTAIDGQAQAAVTVPAGEFAVVSGFHLHGDASAVLIQGSAAITNNTFDDPQAPTNGDVEVVGPGPTSIVANEFSGADALAPNTAVSVAGAAATTSLSRNLVSGYATGVDVASTTGSVALNGDVIFDNPGTGLDLVDEDAELTNLTLWDNGTDISNTDSHLTLDSSIVQDQIEITGTATCTIAFSRGPATGSGCDGFVTDVDPGFEDPDTGDFHLVAASPMIDAGNPAPPTALRDFDGDIRPLDGDGDGACPVERDIGADEFAGAFIDCSPPATPALGPMPLDATAPETLIERGPRKKTKSKSARLAFSSSEPESTFECRLDGGKFEACASPVEAKVRRGKHRFEARAQDAAGNVDASPAIWNWTVKTRKKK
jgi:hypothetical protein